MNSALRSTSVRLALAGLVVAVVITVVGAVMSPSRGAILLVVGLVMSGFSVLVVAFIMKAERSLGARARRYRVVAVTIASFALLAMTLGALTVGVFMAPVALLLFAGSITTKVTN